MTKVTVVSAFVPLDVKHLSRDQYLDYGRQLAEACCDHGVRIFSPWPLSHCWLSQENPPMVPAAPVPADRYATPEANVQSNIVQHSRTQWAMLELEQHPDTDVIVWLDLAILKQGKWNGKPVTPEHIRWFLDHVAKDPLTDIPFPGISGPGPIDPHGNNWRFCGSTHIWPTQFLPQINEEYRVELRRFIRKYGQVPLDLAIWPAVEYNSGLPFRWYQAEYDHTQLSNFPGRLT